MAANPHGRLGHLLLNRFGLLLAVVTVAATLLIQAPGLITLSLNLENTQHHREAARKAGQGSQAASVQRQWQQAVPAAASTEPGAFLAHARELVSSAGCSLESSSEAPAEELAGSAALARIDLTIKVKGTYRQLLDLLASLRKEPRLLAVVRAFIQPAAYPQLTGEIVLRRYVRRSAAYAAQPETVVRNSPTITPVKTGGTYKFRG